MPGQGRSRRRNGGHHFDSAQALSQHTVSAFQPPCQQNFTVWAGELQSRPHTHTHTRARAHTHYSLKPALLCSPDKLLRTQTPPKRLTAGRRTWLKQLGGGSTFLAGAGALRTATMTHNRWPLNSPSEHYASREDREPSRELPIKTPAAKKCVCTCDQAEPH